MDKTSVKKDHRFFFINHQMGMILEQILIAEETERQQ